ncbi:MAG: Gfo/Idh/MocA family oxidoreductase [Rhodospirillales bacterium]|nr:Gfo/Idh/MocA family oxidoreductase [Rhodospirillales bacterium]
MSQKPQKPLRMGILGLGMAGTVMVRGLDGWAGAEISAAADSNENLLASFADDFDAEAHTDMRSLCQSNAVEAVYIATPHQFHAKHAIMAAEHGKHIVLEKPMALTMVDCDAIIEAVEKAGVKLVVGPTHSYDPHVRLMAQMIGTGDFGRLSMINTWNYNDFLYRPRRPEELDTSKGGGIVFNQLPHQIDSIRVLGGGKLQSVRAQLGVLDPARPTEGSAIVLLEFEDGAAATMVYSGYDRFDTDEFQGWIGEGGQLKPGDAYGNSRAGLGALDQAAETQLRAERYGYKSGNGSAPTVPGQAHFGVMVVSCEKGDIKTSPTGLSVFDDNGRREIEIYGNEFLPSRQAVVQELSNAINGVRPALHDGRWAKANMEVALAILQSAKERKEIILKHQIGAHYENGPV